MKVPRPPTDEHKQLIGSLALTTSKLNRSHIAEVSGIVRPSLKALTPRQTSNVMNKARREHRNEADDKGGQVASILQDLREKKGKDNGWNYNTEVDSANVLVGIWWQSPSQCKLARR